MINHISEQNIYENAKFVYYFTEETVAKNSTQQNKSKHESFTMKTITNDFTEKLEISSKTRKNVLSSQKKYSWSIVHYFGKNFVKSTY